MIFNNLSIAKKFLLGFLVVSVIGVSLVLFFMFQLKRVFSLLEKDVPQSVQELKNSSHLDGLAQFIRYYDEVLTQSARNYAFTSDKKWKDRYNSIVPELDKIIKEAIEEGDREDKTFFEQIDASNLALVDMEVKSLSLVDAGHSSEAVAILEGQGYADQKMIYEKGLRDYVAKRGESYNRALEASTKTIDKVNNNARDIVKNSYQLTAILGTLAIIFMAGINLLIVRSISIPIKKLSDMARNISQGDLSKRITITSKDEVGRLATSFNEMEDKLRQSQQLLEQKVSERTTELEAAKNKLEDKVAELEKIQKLIIDRELKMVELKKELEELKNKPENG